MSTCSSILELEKMELADGTLEKMQAAVKTLILGVGEDPSREGLLETPRVGLKSLIIFTYLVYRAPHTRITPCRESPRPGWT